MNDTLKECGCGSSKLTIRQIWPEPRNRWTVDCFDCGYCTATHETEAEAIAAWNARKSPRTDGLANELERLHNAARGYEFDLVPTDGPIARLALFMHENGDRIITALRTDMGDGWQDISSAPRDGTCVLIWADGQVIQARYAVEDDCTWENGRWGLGFGGEYGGDPTHWRPLPAAPALRTGEATDV